MVNLLATRFAWPLCGDVESWGALGYKPVSHEPSVLSGAMVNSKHEIRNNVKIPITNDTNRFLFMNLNYKSSALSRRVPRRAFTLVELMVVLAIIAMLAGLLATYISDVRERARTTYCRNNLRQFGVAIGKYMADHQGYFISPGSAAGFKGTTGLMVEGGGGNVWGDSDGLMGSFSLVQDTMGMRGTAGSELGGVSQDSWNGFINDYVRSSTSVKDVPFCPEVELSIFKTNSSNFKGLSLDDMYGYRLDTVGNATTYAINGNAIYQNQSNLKNSRFAFIDWNAVEGWLTAPGGGALTITYGTSIWYMAKEETGGAVRETIYKNAGAGSAHPLKSGPSYLTEIGYHHRSGTNRFANYVAIDGHVDSIASNAPEAEFRQLFLGY